VLLFDYMEWCSVQKVYVMNELTIRLLKCCCFLYGQTEYYAIKKIVLWYDQSLYTSVEMS